MLSLRYVLVKVRVRYGLCSLRHVFVELRGLNRSSCALYTLSPGFISRPEDVLSCLRLGVSKPLPSRF